MTIDGCMMDALLPLLLPLQLLLLAHPCICTSSYRHYYVDNADVCSGSDNPASEPKVLDLGEGAAIISLKSPSQRLQPEYRNKAVRCKIHLKVPEEQKGSLGLMAYVEEMHLRQNSRDDDCVDYVQFGQDDRLPFVTLNKSDRYILLPEGYMN